MSNSDNNDNLYFFTPKLLTLNTLFVIALIYLIVFCFNLIPLAFVIFKVKRPLSKEPDPHYYNKMEEKWKDEKKEQNLKDDTKAPPDFIFGTDLGEQADEGTLINNLSASSKT